MQIPKDIVIFYIFIVYWTKWSVRGPYDDCNTGSYLEKPKGPKIMGTLFLDRNIAKESPITHQP